MPTVNEILDRYERDHVPKLGPRTQGDYTRHIAVLRREFGTRTAENLVPSDFDKFLDVQKGRIQRTRQLAVLSSAFSQAVWWKWLQHNVCMQVARHRARPRDRYVTTDELEGFKAFVTKRPGKGIRQCLAMDLAVQTGIPQRGVLGLRWADVNTVERTISYEKSKGRRVTVPMPSKVRALVEQCRALNKSQGIFVLTQRNGNRYTSEGFRAMFQRGMRRWCKGGKNKPFRFQDLHATWEKNRQSLGTAEERALISRGSESPGVEMKQWMTLSDPLVRANVARHLAALANYGGGHLIFGLLKDGSPDPNHPGDLATFNNDEIAGIVDRYLTPPFHCEVSVVSPDGADPCVVVRVPSHASVPICAKADGPHNSKGKPQGILKGRYYIRVNGPKSEPIESPEQWTLVIRRCVLNERQSLLDSIASLLTPQQSRAEPTPAVPAVLSAPRAAEPPKRLRKRFGQRRRDTIRS